MLQSSGRYISLSTFLLILLCFLLPFLRITCSGQEILNLSGYELAFGATKTIDTGWDSRTEKAEPVVSALVCLIAAIVGAGLTFVSGKSGSLMRLIAAAIGFILLCIVPVEVRAKMGSRSAGADIGVKLGVGWIVTSLLFIGAAVVSILSLATRPRVHSVAAAGPPAGGFCSQCGQPLTADARSCSGCGAQRQ